MLWLSGPLQDTPSIKGKSKHDNIAHLDGHLDEHLDVEFMMDMVLGGLFQSEGL